MFVQKSSGYKPLLRKASQALHYGGGERFYARIATVHGFNGKDATWNRS
ncbi:hypothetical protein WBP07_20645 (plasmid) [Novosphingobium sp. BL-8A]